MDLVDEAFVASVDVPRGVPMSEAGAAFAVARLAEHRRHLRRREPQPWLGLDAL